MNLFQKYFIFLFLFSISIGFSQEHKNDSINKEIPVSIYTATQISNDLNSLLNVNKRLYLKSYNFLVLDEKNIEMGNFTVPLYNISLRHSSYIYDTFNKVHQKSILEAAFFNVSDLYKPRTKNSL